MDKEQKRIARHNKRTVRFLLRLVLRKNLLKNPPAKRRFEALEELEYIFKNYPYMATNHLNEMYRQLLKKIWVIYG